MLPTLISDAQIINAGENLRAAGLPVNGSSLRKMAGGGGHDRLKRVWDAYQAAQPAGPTATRPVTSPGITQHGNQLVEQHRGDLFGVPQDQQRDLGATQKPPTQQQSLALQQNPTPHELPAANVADAPGGDGRALAARLDQALVFLDQLVTCLNGNPFIIWGAPVRQTIEKATAFVNQCRDRQQPPSAQLMPGVSSLRPTQGNLVKGRTAVTATPGATAS